MLRIDDHKMSPAILKRETRPAIGVDFQKLSAMFRCELKRTKIQYDNAKARCVSPRIDGRFWCNTQCLANFQRYPLRLSLEPPTHPTLAQELVVSLSRSLNR